MLMAPSKAPALVMRVIDYMFKSISPPFPPLPEWQTLSKISTSQVPLQLPLIGNTKHGRRDVQTNPTVTLQKQDIILVLEFIARCSANVYFNSTSQ